VDGVTGDDRVLDGDAPGGTDGSKLEEGVAVGVAEVLGVIGENKSTLVTSRLVVPW
jgi:hypothetical protein